MPRNIAFPFRADRVVRLERIRTGSSGSVSTTPNLDREDHVVFYSITVVGDITDKNASQQFFPRMKVASYQMILNSCIVVAGALLVMQCRKPARLEIRE